jgi:hypothetical protein
MLEVARPEGNLEMPGWLFATLGVREPEGEVWSATHALMLPSDPDGLGKVGWFTIVSVTRYEQHLREIRQSVGGGTGQWLPRRQR